MRGGAYGVEAPRSPRALSPALLKVLSMVQAPGSPLERDSGFGSYYMMLRSTRHYHEGQQERLPPCAQSLNRALVRTIGASQDVLALTLARPRLRFPFLRHQRRLRPQQPRHAPHPGQHQP